MKNKNQNNNGRSNNHRGSGTAVNNVNKARLRFSPHDCSTVFLTTSKGPTIDVTIFGASILVAGELCDMVTVSNPKAFQGLIMDARQLDCGVLSIEMGIHDIEKHKASKEVKQMEVTVKS